MFIIEGVPYETPSMDNNRMNRSYAHTHEIRAFYRCNILQRLSHKSKNKWTKPNLFLALVMITFMPSNLNCVI